MTIMLTQPLILSPHAEERRIEMNIRTKEIKRCLREPEMVYPSGPEHKPGRILYQRGRLVVVTEGDQVVTLLWHMKEGR